MLRSLQELQLKLQKEEAKRFVLLMFFRVAEYLYFLSIAIIAAIIMELVKADNAEYYILAFLGGLYVCVLAALADFVKRK